MVRLTRILGEAGLDPDRLVRAPAGRHCAPSPAMFEAFRQHAQRFGVLMPGR